MTRKGYKVQEVVAGSPAQSRLEAVGYEVGEVRTVRGARIAIMRKLAPKIPSVTAEYSGSGAHLWSVSNEKANRS